jgi:hypothetical protein
MSCPGALPRFITRITGSRKTTPATLVWFVWSTVTFTGRMLHVDATRMADLLPKVPTSNSLMSAKINGCVRMREEILAETSLASGMSLGSRVFDNVLICLRSLAEIECIVCFGFVCKVCYNAKNLHSSRGYIPGDKRSGLRQKTLK